MVRLITKGSNERDWNRIAMKLLPVLIIALILLMFLFNQNSDKVLKAYYNITNQTSPDGEDGEAARFVLLPHHFLLVMIILGTIVVIAFAVYILSSINDDKDYVDTSWDS